MKTILALFLLAVSSFAAQAQIKLTDHGGNCNNTHDNTAALNSAIYSAIHGSEKRIAIPAGDCKFYSKPSDLRDGISLIGQSKSVSVMRRAYSGSFLRVLGNGVRIENLTIFADAGTSGGVGIEMVSSDALGSGGNHNIQNVWITGIGTWAVPLGAWGSDRTLAPQGIRAITLQDVSVFNATWQAVTLWGCVSCEWFGGGAYQGNGTTQQVVIGGAFTYKNYVNANIDWAAAIVQPGSLR